MLRRAQPKQRGPDHEVGIERRSLGAPLLGATAPARVPGSRRQPSSGRRSACRATNRQGEPGAAPAPRRRTSCAGSRAARSPRQARASARRCRGRPAVVRRVRRCWSESPAPTDRGTTSAAARTTAAPARRRCGEGSRARARACAALRATRPAPWARASRRAGRDRRRSLSVLPSCSCVVPRPETAFRPHLDASGHSETRVRDDRAAFARTLAHRAGSGTTLRCTSCRGRSSSPGRRGASGAPPHSRSPKPATTSFSPTSAPPSRRAPIRSPPGRISTRPPRAAALEAASWRRPSPT